MTTTLKTIEIIVPCYNEGSSLAAFFEALRPYIEILDANVSLLFVDDGSTDNTWSLLSEYTQNFTFINSLKLSRNFGKEAAIAAGLDKSKADAVIIMDADLQHPPSLIPEMVRLWRSGTYKVVEAIKKNQKTFSLLYRINSGAFNWFLTKTSGFDFHGASDFKLLDRSVIGELNRLKEKKRFFRGLITWLGFPTTKIYFEVPKGCRPNSKWSLLDLVRLARIAITSFSTTPLHFITVTGIVFALLSLVFSSYTLYMKITGQAVDGFTTVIILQLFIGTLVMLGMGILGEYQSKLYEEVKGRPQYIIEKTAGHNDNDI